MTKEEFKQQQSGAYQVLLNALEQNKVSSAYLFEGNDERQLREVAMLLAKSILCEEGAYACDECVICQRVESLNYADLIFVDGSQNSIKKGDIVQIITQFSQTGIEVYEKKIYILHMVENAVPESMNALLKFLEEPQKDVFAILTTANKERVLDTIISRCQCVKLKPLTIEDTVKRCIEAGIMAEDANICSRIVRNYEDVVALIESDLYETIKTNTLEILEAFLRDPNSGIFEMQNFLKDNKDLGKSEFKDSYSLVIDIMIVVFNECLFETFEKEDYFKRLVEASQKNNNQYILEVLLETKDKLKNALNINLLFDAMLCQMKEGVVRES